MKRVWDKDYALDRRHMQVPVKFWVDPESLDGKCLDQIENLAALPFAKQHIAVLPDAHCGYGMPIGCVLATQGAIIPNAVGVDIGCGMAAMQIFPEEHEMEEVLKLLPKIRHEILRRVPVGFHHHKQSRMNHMPQRWWASDTPMPIVDDQWERAGHQVGTLGGGNHFIEIQLDENGGLWAMVHSGSRNLGKRVCDHYNRLAADQNAQNHSVVTPDQQLAFFHVHDPLAEQYMEEMSYCRVFAEANRDLILTEVLQAFCTILLDTVNVSDAIDICHNSVQIENHFGQNMYIHRKGAAGPLREGFGIIPGSMGTSSYIVAPIDDPCSEAFNTYYTTSHGAGRPMSRSKAKKTLDLKAEQKKMEGIVHGLKSEKALDEAPGAYKDIELVMHHQRNLCEIVHKLRPVASIKG